MAQLWLLAPLVAVLGIPHGALDLRIAQQMWPLNGPQGLVFFATVYLGMAASVLGFWLVVPGAALSAFLCYSALHFAGDWRNTLPLFSRLVLGALVVALPAIFWNGDVALIFTALVPVDMARAIAHALQWIGMAASLAIVYILVENIDNDRDLLFDIGGLVLLSFLAPPIMYFIVYFCFLHSIRHFLDAGQQLRLDFMRSLFAATPLTLVTWALAGIAAFALIRSDVGVDETIVKLVFVGLASLAVPHMLLVERFWVRASASSLR